MFLNALLRVTRRRTVVTESFTVSMGATFLMLLNLACAFAPTGLLETTAN